jgi:hypothetical protein
LALAIIGEKPDKPRKALARSIPKDASDRRASSEAGSALDQQSNGSIELYEIPEHSIRQGKERNSGNAPDGAPLYLRGKSAHEKQASTGSRQQDHDRSNAAYHG